MPTARSARRIAKQAPESQDAHVHVSGAAVVRALERGGFVVYRRHSIATLLERGVRAVAVPNLDELPPQALSSVRQMTGLSVAELDALLHESETATVSLSRTAAVRSRAGR
jgi:hypothetical protein